MKISKENRRKYAGKSMPEYVLLTMLALDNGMLVGCEGGKFDWFDLCRACKIKPDCFMRSFYAFGGGSVQP